MYGVSKKFSIYRAEALGLPLKPYECVPAWRAELADMLLNGDTIRQKLTDDDLCFLGGILDFEGISRDRLCISLVQLLRPDSRGRSFRKTSRNRRSTSRGECFS